MVKGIAFSSDNEEASAIEQLYNIGVAHSKRGKPRDAIFYFDRVLMVNPSHTRAQFNKANALGKLGRYEEAILMYDVILKVLSGHPACLLNKGLALHYLRRYDEAVTCYQKILAKDPENAKALYHIACTKAAQKKHSESLALLERAIVIDYQFAGKAAKDPDFSSLREDQKFQSLVS